MAAYTSNTAVPTGEYAAAPAYTQSPAYAAAPVQTTVVDTGAPVTTTTTTTHQKKGFHLPGFGHKDKGTVEHVEHHQAHQHHHDVHSNPHDEWSSRDLLLSIIPYIIAVAFRDAALSTGLIVAASLSLYVMIKRLSFWGGYGKGTWPVIDITNVILFVILLALSWPSTYRYHIHKWLVVIASATLAFVVLVSLIVRRPFTAHYARYSPTDIHGHSLWNNDKAWRLHNDFSAIAWFWAWSVACVLALAPVLTGDWSGYTALNIIFHYIVPFVLVATALMVTQMMGRRYSRNVAAAAPVGTYTTGAYVPGAATYAPATTGVVGHNAV